MEPLTLLEIRDLINCEEDVLKDCIHLSANETILSPFAQSVLSSSLHNRYLLEHLDMREDSPSRLGHFLYQGLNNINAIEQSATEVCKRLFDGDYVEFRCLSGIHAMQTTIASLTQPGDKVMRFATKDGGHFLTQRICELFGRESCTYAYDREHYGIDLVETAKIFEQQRPKLLYLDAMNYLFPFPIAELRRIVGDTPIVFDASHTLGLIAGGQFQDPLSEGADIVQANTHKTLFGPQKAIIIGKNRELMERISYNLSTAMVSSQHTASTIALFIALHEAFIYGEKYATKVINNAQYLAQSLHNRGVPILASNLGFTRNHMFFIDLRELGFGPTLLNRLLSANISANRAVPFEHVDAIRIGVQEVTRRGYSNSDFDKIADWIHQLLVQDITPSKIKEQVIELAQKRDSILYCDGVGDLPNGLFSGLGKVSREQDANKSRNGTHSVNESSLRSNPIVRKTNPERRWTHFHSDGKEKSVISTEIFNDIRELGRLANSFEHQMDSSGNISFRSQEGNIFVTTSGSFIKDLSLDDLVEILDFKDNILMCRGSGTPSSEAYLHYLIYQSFPCKAIAHAHLILSDAEIAAWKIAVVPPQESGSVSLARVVANAAKKGRIIYIQKHGVVFWDDTISGCKTLIKNFITSTKTQSVS